MKNLVIFCIFVAAFCINFSNQRVLKNGLLFFNSENVEDNPNAKKALPDPPPLIRKKRSFDLSSLGLDDLGLDGDVLKDLTGKITDLLGGGSDGGTKCQVIINNGGGNGEEEEQPQKEEGPQPTPNSCGPHDRLCAEKLP